MGSAFPIRALEASVRTGLFVGVAVLIYSALRTNTGLAHLSLKSLVGLTVVGVAFALLAYSVWPEIYWALRLKGWRSTAISNEFKGFSALIVVLLPLLILSIARLERWWKLAAAIAIAEMATIMWVSSNRAAIAGLLGIGMICSVALFRQQGNRAQGVIFLVGFFSFAAITMIWLHDMKYWKYAEYLKSAPHILSEDWLFPIWLVDFQRQIIWAFALEVWKSAPWFGVGPNSINFSPGANAPLPGAEPLHLIPGHPHNWVVEILAETGIFGLASLVFAIAAAMYGCLKRYFTYGGTAMLSVLMIFAGYWVSSLFNFSYWSAWWQLSFFLATALAFALVRESNEELKT